jgi:serine/threonine-protein kinase
VTEELLAPGTRFGDYEILAELGAGGMGRVYRAKDLTLERTVALKMLAPQYSSDAGFVQRFLKEARAAARLNHPNIVQIYDFGQVGDAYYLAMEYVDGHSLGTYLKRGHFSERDAILVIRHACRALAVAHAEGLVHRDIKPDNLMLTSRGEVKLVDLGIAKRVDEDQSLTQTGQAVGTPHYISPEQIRGSRDVDARADVYSLGATLYHLVTGHTPFRGSSGALVMSMHLVQPLADPRTYVAALTEGLCLVIRKMMAKSRDERYPDVDTLDRDLYRLQTGEAPEGAEPGDTAVETIIRAGAPAAAPAVAPRSGEARASTLPPSRASGQTPAHTAPTHAAFDSGVLNRIEDLLAADVGPMARVLVRRAAKSAPTLEALCVDLAGQVNAGPARETFRSKCLLAARPAGPAPTPAPPTAPPPTRGSAVPRATSPPPEARPSPASYASAPGAAAGGTGNTPGVTEEDLHALEAELSRHVGPLARVLVKRAAKGAGSYAHLVAALEVEIPSEEARRAFRTAVRKNR